MLKVSSQPVNLLTWVVAISIKCNLLEEEALPPLIINLVLGSTSTTVFTEQGLSKLGLRIFSGILWGILILILLSSLGRYLAFKDTVSLTVNTPSTLSTATTTRSTKTSQLLSDVNSALATAREAALQNASDELDRWIGSLMNRVDSDKDDDFLDWYFGYWTQQKFGLSGILQAGKRVFNKDLPTTKETIQAEVLQEFTNRVLRPEIAKLELKAIAKDISDIYIGKLQQNLEKIRIRYKIPAANWEKYLEDATLLVTNVEGEQVPLQLKAFTVASLGGGALLTKAAIAAIEKVTTKVATKVVAKTGSSILGKAGALVGGELLGPVVTIAIVAWDAIDIHNTGANYRPVLRKNIEEYFHLMKQDILGDEKNGIQRVILDIESSIRKTIIGFQFPSLFRGWKSLRQGVPNKPPSVGVTGAAHGCIAMAHVIRTTSVSVLPKLPLPGVVAGIA
jgi:hypothetical protein